MSENSHERNVSDPPSGNSYNEPAKESWPVQVRQLGEEPEEKILGKESWPELVGLPAEEAEKKIKEETKGVKTQVVNEHSMVTTDYRTDRVRLFVNGAGKVVQAPRIG